MKRIITMLAIVCLQFPCWGQAGASIPKSNLKILYVGGSTDYNKSDTAEHTRQVQERMASFENMLKKYFNSVTVIHANDYVQELSNHYHVTVMDGTPKPISPRMTETDASGRVSKYIPAKYLTEDFDRPMLFIGELGEVMGRNIGLKTDWYCLCLSSNAHSWRAEHPIFRTPFDVRLNAQKEATPKDAFHYAYFSDTPVPDSVMMWKVQTKDYITDPDFRVGMVARPWGFKDSPDAEYISGGTNSKTLDAVAIGRHGNFLHWGFVASPAHMTQEGQTVLANAIVYISTFDGRGVIARKYESRIATRQWLKELKYYAARETYEIELKQDQEFEKIQLEAQKNALIKKENGETLTRRDSSALNYRPSAPISMQDFLKRHQRVFYELVGNDPDAYAKFYDDNYDYFYGFGFYHLEIDEDVKSLGIPNYDKQILDEAIKLWESNKDPAKAKRILTRYTLVDFATAKEWRHWYNTYKNQIFFTEAGGWLFLINSQEPEVNNYHAKEVRQAMSAIQPEDTNDLNPVNVATGIVNKGNGVKEVVVKIKIHPGYHIYALVSEEDPYIAAAINIDLPEDYYFTGAWKEPSFRSFNNSGTTIYEDEIVFRREIMGSGAKEIKCTIVYQCCDNHTCFPPENKVYTVKIQ